MFLYSGLHFADDAEVPMAVLMAVARDADAAPLVTAEGLPVTWPDLQVGTLPRRVCHWQCRGADRTRQAAMGATAMWAGKGSGGILLGMDI